jgi:hypothetical protein
MMVIVVFLCVCLVNDWSITDARYLSVTRLLTDHWPPGSTLTNAGSSSAASPPLCPIATALPWTQL